MAGTSDGVYLAPGKLFKMSSPFPDEPIVSDGRQPENNNAGAVSFIDMTGRLNGVLYMEDKGRHDRRGRGRPDAPPRPTGSATLGFPRFFQSGVPDAKVLRERGGHGRGTSRPGSPLPTCRTARRSACRPRTATTSSATTRGAVWLWSTRGKYYYLLQTELRVEKLAGPDWKLRLRMPPNWNEFVPELEALYLRIEFLKP